MRVAIWRLNFQLLNNCEMENLNYIKKLSGDVFGKIEYVADLLYFDGPLLSFYKNDRNQKFLFYWVDVDGKYNRWLVTETSPSDVIKYLKSKLSLYNLLTSKIKTLYKVDIDNNLNFNDIELLDIKDLPDSYLPEKDTYFLKDDISDDVNDLISKCKQLLPATPKNYAPQPSFQESRQYEYV